MSDGSSSELPSHVPIQGSVKAWNDARGFGFLTPDSGGPDVFVHRNVLMDGQMLEEGAPITFEVAWNVAKGKYAATKCTGASGQGTNAPAAPAPAPMDSALSAALMDPAQVAALRKGLAKAGKEPSDNIFVSGLPLDSSEDYIRQVFNAYGSITQFKMLPDSGRPDRAALIRMGNLDQAKWIVDNLHGNIPQGLQAPIVVRYADNRAEKAKALGLPKGVGKGDPSTGPDSGSGPGYGSGSGSGSGSASDSARYSPYGPPRSSPSTLPPDSGSAPLASNLAASANLALANQMGGLAAGCTNSLTSLLATLGRGGGAGAPAGLGGMSGLSLQGLGGLGGLGASAAGLGGAVGGASGLDLQTLHDLALGGAAPSAAGGLGGASLLAAAAGGLDLTKLGVGAGGGVSSSAAGLAGAGLDVRSLAALAGGSSASPLTSLLASTAGGAGAHLGSAGLGLGGGGAASSNVGGLLNGCSLGAASAGALGGAGSLDIAALAASIGQRDARGDHAGGASSAGDGGMASSPDLLQALLAQKAAQKASQQSATEGADGGANASTADLMQKLMRAS